MKNKLIGPFNLVSIIEVVKLDLYILYSWHTYIATYISDTDIGSYLFME